MQLSDSYDRLEIENFYKKVSETERTCNEEINHAMWYLRSLFEDSPQREFVYVRNPQEKYPVDFVVKFLVKKEVKIPLGGGQETKDYKTFYDWHHHLGYINRLFIDEENDLVVEVTVSDFSEEIGKHYIIDVASLPHDSFKNVFRFLLDSTHLWVKG